MHDFRNRISLTEAWSKTPTLKRFVKSNDVLDVESLYKLFLWPVGGLYARANLLTTVFATEQVTSEPVTYVPEGGDPVDDGQTVRRFELSDPLQPLTVSESLGAFLDPIQEPHLQLSLRAGFGGRHTLADGARLITSDEDPDAIVFETLEDVHQAGLELFGGAGGRAVEDRLRYDVGLVALVPFINNDDRDRNALDLARIGFHADLNVAVFDWMSLSYQLRVVNDPQLVDDLQVQNNLLITLAYTVVKKPEPPPAPDPLAAELAAEKARADAAEARAVAAEARAVAAEQAAATQPGATTAEASEPAPSETTPQQPAEESAPTEPTAPAPADPNEGTATPAVEQP
ncbi:MAG: hypothetical protein OXR73_23890 [Myxococcales bacterium]|nr:hypothetical protein [Myxococcales bacterium]